MSLIEELKNLSKKIREYSGQDLSEADTETFCFEPFIGLLGFERTPADMQKRYPADQRGKGKKVDYAIKKDGVSIMIVECKALGDDLDDDTGQLSEYFTAVRGARFGILTDGHLYRFYTDLDEPNIMDRDPFLEIDLFDIQPHLVTELEWFTKSRFNVNQALAASRRLKSSKAIRQFLLGLLESPTEDFVNYVASEVNIAMNTPDRRQQITEIVQQILKEFKGGEDSDAAPPPDDLPDNGDSTTELYHQYWTAHRKHLEERNGVIKTVAPNKGHWLYFFPFRDSRFRLGVTASVKGKFIRVQFLFWGKNAKRHFNSFKQDRSAIEKAIDAKLEWNEKPNKKESDIQLILSDRDPRKRGDWNRQHQWLCDKLELFYEVFKPRIDALKKEKTSDA